MRICAPQPSCPGRRHVELWLALLLSSAAFGSTASTDYLSYRTKALSITVNKAYQEVIDDLEFAISEKNFRITGRNTIGQGIQARGHTQFPQMEIVHFCSLEQAREVLELRPSYLILMPCRVAIRAIDARHTNISAVLLPDHDRDRRIRRFAQRLNRMIRDIVHSGSARP